MRNKPKWQTNEYTRSELLVHKPALIYRPKVQQRNDVIFIKKAKPSSEKPLRT